MILWKTEYIWEGTVGVHLHNGRVIGILHPGKYTFWGNGHLIVRYDQKAQFDFFGGQECTTKDGGSVKISLFLTYQIVDPVTLYRTSSQAYGPTYALQIAAKVGMRDWVLARTLEEVMEQREALGDALLPLLVDQSNDCGVKILGVSVIEFNLVGAMRTAYANLLATEIEGKTALAKARNETATMRSLLNTARLVREHPGLLELRVLASGQKPRVSFVVNSRSDDSTINLADDAEDA
jgi:regulator of protease activity HflC (stomatin/prohibitin superfamily)